VKGADSSDWDRTKQAGGGRNDLPEIEWAPHIARHMIEDRAHLGKNSFELHHIMIISLRLGV